MQPHMYYYMYYYICLYSTTIYNRNSLQKRHPKIYNMLSNSNSLKSCYFRLIKEQQKNIKDRYPHEKT